VELGHWDDIEKSSKDLAGNLVSIDIELVEVATLDDANEDLSSIVVDVVVLNHKLSQGWALRDQLADQGASVVCDVVFSQAERRKLLLLLVLECVSNHLDSLITDVVSRKIELSDCLTVLEHIFQLR